MRDSFFVYVVLKIENNDYYLMNILGKAACKSLSPYSKKNSFFSVLKGRTIAGVLARNKHRCLETQAKYRNGQFIFGSAAEFER